MKRIKMLESERIALVVPEKEDAQVWYEWINDIETQAFITNFWNILHKETEEEYYETLRKNKSQKTFSIFVKDSGKIIGNISLFDINNISRNTTLGIMICDKEEQNKWYGTESMKLILKYAFEILGLHKVSLHYVDFNTRAGKVYEKVGFSEIGRQKEQRYIYGKYHDSVLMEIMRSEYEKNNS